MNIEEEIRNIKEVLRRLILSDASYQAITTGKVISYTAQQNLLKILDNSKEKRCPKYTPTMDIYCHKCGSRNIKLSPSKEDNKINIKCVACGNITTISGRLVE